MTPDGQLSLTVDPLADAIAWKRRNPEAYRELLMLAREDMKHGARPVIDLYVNLLRRPHFARKLGLQRSDVAFLVNNNLRSGLARLLKREHGIPFETRKATVDGWSEAS